MFKIIHSYRSNFDNLNVRQHENFRLNMRKLFHLLAKADYEQVTLAVRRAEFLTVREMDIRSLTVGEFGKVAKCVLNLDFLTNNPHQKLGDLRAIFFTEQRGIQSLFTRNLNLSKLLCTPSVKDFYVDGPNTLTMTAKASYAPAQLPARVTFRNWDNQIYWNYTESPLFETYCSAFVHLGRAVDGILNYLNKTHPFNKNEAASYPSNDLYWTIQSYVHFNTFVDNHLALIGNATQFQRLTCVQHTPLHGGFEIVKFAKIFWRCYENLLTHHFNARSDALTQAVEATSPTSCTLFSAEKPFLVNATFSVEKRMAKTLNRFNYVIFSVQGTAEPAVDFNFYNPPDFLPPEYVAIILGRKIYHLEERLTALSAPVKK